VSSLFFFVFFFFLSPVIFFCCFLSRGGNRWLTSCAKEAVQHSPKCSHLLFLPFFFFSFPFSFFFLPACCSVSNNGAPLPFLFWSQTGLALQWRYYDQIQGAFPFFSLSFFSPSPSPLCSIDMSWLIVRMDASFFSLPPPHAVGIPRKNTGSSTWQRLECPALFPPLLLLRRVVSACLRSMLSARK